MAVYEYACEECGRFDVRLDIGCAPAGHDCPRCGASARRAFSAPMLQLTAKPLRTLLAKEEQSRERPEVTTGVPPRAHRRAPAPAPNPALARLPRP